MTVAELIAKLSEYPPDSEVALAGGMDGEGYIDIYSAESRSITLGCIEEDYRIQPIDVDKLSPTNRMLYEMILNSKSKGSYAEAIRKFINPDSKE